MDPKTPEPELTAFERGANRRRQAIDARRQRATRMRVIGAGVAAALLVVIAVAVTNRDGGDTSGASTTGAAASLATTGGDFHSLVADPTTPGRLFAGGHQAVSLSTDAGASWRGVAELRDADGMGWAFTDDAIYVSGHPGLNRSADDAEQFDRINDGLPGTDVHAFGAGGGKLYGFAIGVGVFASDDAGANWTTVAAVPGASFFGRILVDEADDQHLVAADASTGPVESRDGGETWSPLGPRLPVTWVTGTPDLGTLIVSGPEGAFRTDDGGATWDDIELPAGASLVELAPDGETLYTGIHREPYVEVHVSTDGGVTWSRP